MIASDRRCSQTEYSAAIQSAPCDGDKPIIAVLGFAIGDERHGS